jgi:hypothetical protein
MKKSRPRHEIFFSFYRHIMIFEWYLQILILAFEFLDKVINFTVQQVIPAVSNNNN